ncbi:ABC transporter substrate-binding protein [Desulfomicrobium escambiense]|uniref:ABC transporter substrate-binding protein n=1 Tax=Desulfomicrobium escambiense TaxID=29503 RepID=UPI0004275A85|nr:ABC transporter substrate-binding protein [Desulfomicrobium escambiense]
MKKLLLLTVLALAATVGSASAAYKVGLLSDLTGATSSVGTPYAEGIKAYVAWLNENGGIGGEPVELIQVDYAYNVQQALAAYKRFTSEGIVAMQGWGTGDTEALVKFVAKDRIPVFSASYSAHLMDPAKAPYNFTAAADYSTMGRAGLNYLRETWKESRAPKLAFMFPDNPYGSAPIPAMEEYAKELGFEIVGKENVDLKAIDATPQLLSLKKAEPDFVWTGGTTPSTAVIMKDAQKLGMTCTFFSNIWSSDENIFKLAGDAANGHFGLQGAAIYGQPSAGMDLIRTITKDQPQMTHYVRGFVSAMVMCEGMKMAKAKGEVTGESIKAALETMRDFDPMGLAPVVSYFADDHRPNLSVNICTFKDGKLEFVQTTVLERKKEWLGL